MLQHWTNITLSLNRHCTQNQADCRFIMPRIVTLSGGSPWGFRLVGGCDFHANLAISKVKFMYMDVDTINGVKCYIQNVRFEEMVTWAFCHQMY